MPSGVRQLLLPLVRCRFSLPAFASNVSSSSYLDLGDQRRSFLNRCGMAGSRTSNVVTPSRLSEAREGVSTDTLAPFPCPFGFWAFCAI